MYIYIPRYVYICMNLGTYVCMYVDMYVDMYVWHCMYVYISRVLSKQDVQLLQSHLSHDFTSCLGGT